MPRPRGAAGSTPGDNAETALAAALALHLDTVDGEQTAHLHDAYTLANHEVRRDAAVF